MLKQLVRGVNSNFSNIDFRLKWCCKKYWWKSQLHLFFFSFFLQFDFFFLLLVCHSSYILHVCTNCCRYHPCDDIFSYCIAIMSQWTLIWSRRLSKRNFSIQKSLKYVIKKISHDFRHYMIIIQLVLFSIPSPRLEYEN